MGMALPLSTSCGRADKDVLQALRSLKIVFVVVKHGVCLMNLTSEFSSTCGASLK